MPLRAQLRLGRIAGIEIGLHFSWFIIAVLITLSLVRHFHEVTPEWSPTVTWSAALVTAFLFFAALLSASGCFERGTLRASSHALTCSDCCNLTPSWVVGKVLSLL